MPLFQHHRDKAAVGGAGTVENIKAGHLNHILNRRIGQQQLARLGHHRFGTLQRRRLRQLYAGKEIALILLRQKAFRHLAKAEGHQTGGGERRHQRQPQTTVHPFDQRTVAVTQRRQGAVKSPPDGGRLRGTRAQQQRAQRRRQGERDDARHRHRRRQRDGKLAIQLTDNPRQERHRNKHRQQHQRCGDHRPGDLP
ncbi:Uncharacterised protein [Raoultella planticola]|uniref:Uncharacterized protein n=1 Tax=Raoultella planticola TaxID=575 RepID=A0A485DCP0_RAOPL|nr:Uncharacterised protein [Raoultella planticola]